MQRAGAQFCSSDYLAHPTQSTLGRGVSGTGAEFRSSDYLANLTQSTLGKRVSRKLGYSSVLWTTYLANLTQPIL